MRKRYVLLPAVFLMIGGLTFECGRLAFQLQRANQMLEAQQGAVIKFVDGVKKERDSFLLKLKEKDEVIAGMSANGQKRDNTITVLSADLQRMQQQGCK